MVQAFGDALAGTGKTFIGIGLTRTGDRRRDATINANPRSAVARAIAGLTERGRAHHPGRDPAGDPQLAGQAGLYPDADQASAGTRVCPATSATGANRWPAAHTLDVASLYRLALEQAPAGAQLYAAAEEGIPVREIAEAIGRQLGIPAVSIPAGEAADHFKGFPFITMDITMPNADTRQLLGWEPIHPRLIADLDDGHYFTTD